MNDLVIYGGTAITVNAKWDVIPDAVIEVKNGKISSITSQSGFKKPANGKSLDARDCLLMPGLINGHTHVGMTLLRGIADDLPLQQWLMEVIFPLEKKWISPEFVTLGTELAALEFIKAGITTFNDMYFLEKYVVEASSKAGIRGLCGKAIVEIGVEEKPAEVIYQAFDEYLEWAKDFPLSRPALAPHSIYGVSVNRWKHIVDYVEKKDVLIHTHLSETQGEVDECLKKHGKTPTELLDSVGVWDQKVIAAHSVCLNEKEIGILGKKKVGISYNPESNLKLETKICPVVELRKAGANVAFGTDSVASNNNLDLLSEADIGAKLQTLRYGTGRFRSEDVVRCLTQEAANAIGMGREIGSLEVGKAADLIAVNLNQPHLIPMYNPYSHLVYAAGGGDVKHTVVNGQVLMENRTVLSLDESDILSRARQFAKKIKPGT